MSSTSEKPNRQKDSLWFGDDQMTEAEFFPQLQKIRQFQMNDLKNAEERANANFLVCVGCLNATELLGGIGTGLIGRDKWGDSIMRFQSGIELLGDSYRPFRDNLWELRNSMIHAYLGRTRTFANVAIGTDKEPNARRYPQGVQVVKDGFTIDHLIVNVSAWIRDLDTAWDNLLARLQNDEGLRKKAVEAFEKLPYLR